RASLPRLYRVGVHVQARREIALGQPDPPSEPQDEPTKAVARAAKRGRHHDAPHRHPEDDNADAGYWHAQAACSPFATRASSRRYPAGDAPPTSTSTKRCPATSSNAQLLISA